MNPYLNTKSKLSLCFNKDDFVMNDFSVDRFVSECRQHTSLETMKEDLNIYHKILCTAMMELINENYVDFVNLSSNLVGLEKSIKNLTQPLEGLQHEIKEVKGTLEETLNTASKVFSDRISNHVTKEVIQHVLCVLEGLEKISLLGRSTKGDEKSLDLENLERIACSFNTVKFHMQKVSLAKDLGDKQEVVQTVAKTLEDNLEIAFLQSLTYNNSQNVYKILCIFSVIGQEQKAEVIFRQEVVSPFMKNLMSMNNITKQSLPKIYRDIVNFIQNDCSILFQYTSDMEGGKDKVPGFDFLINSVWPEVVQCLEYISPSHYHSLGDPQLFQQNYSASVSFLREFESCCKDPLSIHKLHQHPAYEVFVGKWNLDVYYQIRLQEIAGDFENALFENFSKSKDESSPYGLHCSDSFWCSLNRCWSDTVYLPRLRSNFWSLTLQLLSRHKNWLASNILLVQIENVIDNVFIMKDVELLISKVNEFYLKCICPKLITGPTNNLTDANAAFKEALNHMTEIPPLASKHIAKLLTNQCTSHLKWIANIPQRFRKTNREIPSKPSPYVSQVLSPLTEFLSATHSMMSSDWAKLCENEVMDGILKQYNLQVTDVLTSIKKMEDSLKILKRARDKPSGSTSTGTMTDDDKIRRQLSIDVNYLEELISNSDLKNTNSKDLLELKDLVTSAERSTGFTANS